MNTATWVLLAVAAVLAVTDWYAVATERRSLEYVAKPATMVPLIAAALALTPDVPAMRGWFVAALVLSLAGDVFLMLPDPKKFFVPGLAAFLVGHVLYIVGFAHDDLSAMALLIGVILTFVALLSIGPTIVKGSSEIDAKLPVPVTAYVLTISVMVTFAIGSARVAAIVGALLFFISDACIGWSRFVAEFRHHRLVIMTTYHLAQALLVVSLVG